MLLVPGCIEPETASTFLNQQPDPTSCVNPGLSGAPAQGHDRGPGAKALDRTLAIPPGRRRLAGDGAEAGLTERRLQWHGGRGQAGGAPANADRQIGPEPLG